MYEKTRKNIQQPTKIETIPERRKHNEIIIENKGECVVSGVLEVVFTFRVRVQFYWEKMEEKMEEGSDHAKGCLVIN